MPLNLVTIAQYQTEGFEMSYFGENNIRCIYSIIFFNQINFKDMFVLVETIGPLKNVAGNKRKTRDLTVRDDSSGFSIKVALWNALAESFSATNKIILMRKVKAEKYLGIKKLSISLQSTVWTNPPECEAKNKFQNFIYKFLF